MNLSRWKPVKLWCIYCDQEFYRRIPPNIPPELGKIIFCTKCLQKYLYWDDKFFILTEVIPKVKMNGWSNLPKQRVKNEPI